MNCALLYRLHVRQYRLIQPLDIKKSLILSFSGGPEKFSFNHDKYFDLKLLVEQGPLNTSLRKLDSVITGAVELAQNWVRNYLIEARIWMCKVCLFQAWG